MISLLYGLIPPAPAQPNLLKKAQDFGYKGTDLEEASTFITNLNKDINRIPTDVWNLFFRITFASFTKIEQLNPMAFFHLPIDDFKSWETLAESFITLIKQKKITLNTDLVISQIDKDQKLITAASCKHPKAVKLLWILGASLSTMIQKEESFSTIQFAIECMTDELSLRDKITFLQCAIQYHDNPQVTEYLIQVLIDSDTNALNAHKLIIHSAHFGSKETSSLLLKYGATLTVQDSTGLTPLMLVTMSKNKEQLELFLDPKYLVDIESIKAALIVAENQHNSEIIDLLRQACEATKPPLHLDSLSSLRSWCDSSNGTPTGGDPSTNGDWVVIEDPNEVFAVF